MIRRRSARLVSLCLATSIAVVSSGAALAAPPAAKKPAAAPSKAGTFNDATAEGIAKYSARDFQGAIQAFQKAVELSPKNALGHYFLGEAQLAAGNVTEAEAAWNRASLTATDQDPALRAKILFVLADLKERQKKWEDAKAAWQVYLDWAAKYPKSNAFPGSGQSRQNVIDTQAKNNLLSAAVKARIAETKAGGVFTDVNKTPATPLPK